MLAVFFYPKTAHVNMHNHFERLIKLKFFVSKGVVEESDGLLSKEGGTVDKRKNN